MLTVGRTFSITIPLQEGGPKRGAGCTVLCRVSRGTARTSAHPRARTHRTSLRASVLARAIPSRDYQLGIPRPQQRLVTAHTAYTSAHVPSPSALPAKAATRGSASRNDSPNGHQPTRQHIRSCDTLRRPISGLICCTLYFIHHLKPHRARLSFHQITTGHRIGLGVHTC